MTTRTPAPSSPSSIAEVAGKAGPIAVVANWIRRLASWRIWIVSAVVFLVFVGVFFASSAPFSIPQVEAACGQTPLDVRFFTSGDDVTSFLDACGPNGRDAYRNMQVADLFYPIVFGVFGASSLALVINRLSLRASSTIWLAAVPLLASAFDYMENVFAWLALTNYPEPAPTNAILGLASACKTATSWVGGILLLGALVALGVRLVRRKTRTITDDRRGPDPTDRRVASA